MKNTSMFHWNSGETGNSNGQQIRKRTGYLGYYCSCRKKEVVSTVTVSYGKEERQPRIYQPVVQLQCVGSQKMESPQSTKIMPGQKTKIVVPADQQGTLCICYPT